MSERRRGPGFLFWFIVCFILLWWLRGRGDTTAPTPTELRTVPTLKR